MLVWLHSKPEFLNVGNNLSENWFRRFSFTAFSTRFTGFTIIVFTNFFYLKMCK
jgi:hypothetical protein